MKCRLKYQHRQKGIALVITLVMLAIVTVMAIVFLAVTRRERSSVKVSEETAIAKDMADAALERVKTEALATMNANGSRLHYDIFNSRAFYSTGPNADDNNPLGDLRFTAGNGSPTNVVHTRFWPGMPENNYLRMLANLQYDPAVPVFVETNRDFPMEFRYYLDFNRNGQFETNFTGNGWAENFLKSTNFYGRYVGDPEWIGMLERPDFPHSETNRFIGRFAYLALPAGKSLDLNFIHNEVQRGGPLNGSGAGSDFSRGQGVGSWEINLAAFLRELNGNIYSWGANNSYILSLGPGQVFQASGNTFDDARSLLGFRLLGPDGSKSRDNLLSLYDTLSRPNPYDIPLPVSNFQNVYQRNFVEDYSRRPPLSQNGNIFFPPNQAATDAVRDNVTGLGWPGSINTNAYTDLQQLFSVDATSAGFVSRLTTPARLGANGNSGRSSYDRYTLYRLASQLGTDSTPATEGKIHLNFKNPVGVLTNVTERWFENPTNAIMFFTNAAELMLRASIDETITISNNQQVAAYRRPNGKYYRIGDTLVRTDFSMTNIQVYATNAATPGIVLNEYTPTIHRILQVAANIYDAMTNRADMLPSVFMPVFTNTGTNIIITRFVTVGGRGETNSAEAFLAREWIDPESAFTNRILALSPYNLWGQHMVIGAKKGHPNFNELALNSRVEFSRKLLMRKTVATSTNITATNQMFLVGMEQRWGIEAWNSYAAQYSRSLTVTGAVQTFVALRDTTNLAFAPVFVTNKFLSNMVKMPTWQGRSTVSDRDRNMLVLLDTNYVLLNERSYNSNKPLGPDRFSDTNEVNFTSQLNLPPEFILYTTNRVRYWVLDDATGRLVDFVSFDRLTTQMDLREELRQNQSAANGTDNNARSYWDTNIVSGSLTRGVTNQLAVSLGELQESQWGNYSTYSQDKAKGISKFRQFVGAPLRTGVDTNLAPLAGEEALRMQVPFTPTKQMIQRLAWQVNDPLVHYMVGDLRRDRFREFESFTGVGRLNNDTNWNIGQRNIRIYHPWGQKDAKDQFAFNIGLMDPGVRSSDDWQFPPYLTNFTHFPSIGMLGQVHRGTPWQTIYLKSFYRTNIDTGQLELFTDPSIWYNWAGTVGNHPIGDWRLLDCFSAAPNENAARGLLSVNQTNTAAWSAVLSGTFAAANTIANSGLLPYINKGVPDPNGAYSPKIIAPGSAEIAAIVRSINQARTNQLEIVANPDPNENKNKPYIARYVTNSLVRSKPDYWRYMGEVLSAPALSVQSPFLNRHELQVKAVWNDRAVEFIPQQILGLLKRDEPRFVVYAFGQSLKPAPRSLTTDPAFYHMCTNYQVTGEVITKTTFRVEGRPMDPSDPLRPVIEKYEILPPVE
jgi:hypothetical protein